MFGRRQASKIILFLFLVCVPVQSVRAEVVHGYATLLSRWLGSYGGSDDGFDFASQSIVSWTMSTDADLSFTLNVFFENPVIAFKNCQGDVANVSLEQLSQAPEGLGPLGGVNVQLNQTVVLKTGDNIYVKFAARSFDGYYVRLEYYVQTDGSPSFTLLAVKASTWGSVKALYR